MSAGKLGKFKIGKLRTMKKSLIFFCLISLLCLKANAAATDLVNLGLVSQLVEVKYISEAWLSKAIADTAKTKLSKDSAVIYYNDVRIQLDRIIFQLTADMVEHNSVRIYHRLNTYFTTHRFAEHEGAAQSVLPYVRAFNDLQHSFKTTINPDKRELKAELLSAATMLSVVSTSWTILKGIREQRGKKVDGIVELLNNLRLNSAADLSKARK